MTCTPFQVTDLWRGFHGLTWSDQATLPILCPSLPPFLCPHLTTHIHLSIHPPTCILPSIDLSVCPPAHLPTVPLLVHLSKHATGKLSQSTYYRSGRLPDACRGRGGHLSPYSGGMRPCPHPAAGGQAALLANGPGLWRRPRRTLASGSFSAEDGLPATALAGQAWDSPEPWVGAASHSP